MPWVCLQADVIEAGGSPRLSRNRDIGRTASLIPRQLSAVGRPISWIECIVGAPARFSFPISPTGIAAYPMKRKASLGLMYRPVESVQAVAVPYVQPLFVKSVRHSCSYTCHAMLSRQTSCHTGGPLALHLTRFRIQKAHTLEIGTPYVLACSKLPVPTSG
jgi:hypothetical protein